MSEIIGVMFKLLRSVFNGNEELTETDKKTVKENLKPLFMIAKKHDVAHLVSYAVLKNDLIDKENDAEIYANYKQEQILAVYRYERINYALNEICTALEQAEIEFIPLKGSVIRDYYPEPWMRTSCDIDILVHESDAVKAMDLLCDKYNYKRGETSTTHDYSLHSPSGAHLELHYTLNQDGSLPDTDKLLDFVWDYTETEKNCKYKKKLISEMFLFYHIAHMAKHFINGGCGIRPFVDLKLLFEKMPFDKEKFQNMLKEGSLTTFYEVVLSLSEVWFDKKPHTGVTKQTEYFILTGGVYGTVQNSAAVKAGKGESKRTTLFKLIFLNRKSLEVIYPNLKKHPILLPFYQVKRWFRVFKKDKREKVKKISKARNAVSNDQALSTADLLNNLGLKN